MKWITGFDSINGQNCMILNFGWLAENSLPQLVTNIDNDEVFDVEIVREALKKRTAYFGTFPKRGGRGLPKPKL